jgi:hypothetical protein
MTPKLIWNAVQDRSSLFRFKINLLVIAEVALLFGVPQLLDEHFAHRSAVLLVVAGAHKNKNGHSVSGLPFHLGARYFYHALELVAEVEPLDLFPRGGQVFHIVKEAPDAPLGESYIFVQLKKKLGLQCNTFCQNYLIDLCYVFLRDLLVFGFRFFLLPH